MPVYIPIDFSKDADPPEGTSCRAKRRFGGMDADLAACEAANGHQCGGRRLRYAAARLLRNGKNG